MMQESWSTAITGLDRSVPRPEPRGRVSPVTPKTSDSSSSRLSPVVVCLGSFSGSRWSATSSSVSVARLRSISSEVVVTSMPSSHGRTQAAA